MRNNFQLFIIFLVFLITERLINPDLALATQAHGAPEGIYAHQMAHLIFAFSMGFLIYWQRKRNLVREAGWRFIQYAALFFILWNIDTFVVHLLDEQFNIIQVKRINLWQMQINVITGHRSLNVLYYFTKLDHLLCVPGMLFLYFGLRRLSEEAGQNISENTQP
ncbi:MAG: hypothetical protein P1P89_16555 [Desulfobacterales bacterium]|nr:hypothetical protein [Desulfobacterales bacterium]